MIKVFKLITGEEIISNTTIDVKLDIIYLTKPRLVHVSATPEGKLAVGLAPWLVTLSEDATVGLCISHIVAEWEPSKAMCDFYLQNTSSIDLTTRF